VVYPPELLDRLQAITPTPWSGQAFRQDVGIGPAEITADDMIACRQLGGAVHWLERDGLLLPSARSPSTNLVIFPANRPADARFDIIGAEPVNP
jgi:RES domain